MIIQELRYQTSNLACPHVLLQPHCSPLAFLPTLELSELYTYFFYNFFWHDLCSYTSDNPSKLISYEYFVSSSEIFINSLSSSNSTSTGLVKSYNKEGIIVPFEEFLTKSKPFITEEEYASTEAIEQTLHFVTRETIDTLDTASIFQENALLPQIASDESCPSEDITTSTSLFTQKSLAEVLVKEPADVEPKIIVESPTDQPKKIVEDAAPHPKTALISDQSITGIAVTETALPTISSEETVLPALNPEVIQKIRITKAETVQERVNLPFNPTFTDPDKHSNTEQNPEPTQILSRPLLQTIKPDAGKDKELPTEVFSTPQIGDVLGKASIPETAATRQGYKSSKTKDASIFKHPSQRDTTNGDIIKPQQLIDSTEEFMPLVLERSESDYFVKSPPLEEFSEELDIFEIATINNSEIKPTISFKNGNLSNNVATAIKNMEAQPQDQIALVIKYAASYNKNEVRVNLYPESLGTIDIRIEFNSVNSNERQIEKITITPERPSTLKLLEDSKAELEASLTEPKKPIITIIAEASKKDGSLEFEMGSGNNNSQHSGHFESFEQKENWMHRFRNFIKLNEGSSIETEGLAEQVMPTEKIYGYSSLHFINMEV